MQKCQYVSLKISEIEAPFFAFTVGMTVFSFEFTRFFEVAIAGNIARSAADRTLICVLSRGVEIDIVENFSCRIGCDFLLACDYFESVGEITESIGTHKGVFQTVRTVVVDRTLPCIGLAVVVYRMTGTALYTFTAGVAE